MDSYEEAEEMNLEKKLREKQYYALLSVENVVFNDKEFYESLAIYNTICEVFGEDPHKYTLDQLGKLK